MARFYTVSTEFSTTPRIKKAEFSTVFVENPVEKVAQIVLFYITKIQKIQKSLLTVFLQKLTLFLAAPQNFTKSPRARTLSEATCQNHAKSPQRCSKFHQKHGRKFLPASTHDIFLHALFQRGYALLSRNSHLGNLL